MVLVIWDPESAQAQSSIQRGFKLRSVFEQYIDLAKQERYPEAEAYARETLALGEAQFGPDHENVGHFLTNLAELHQLQARPGAAVPLLERALSVFEGVFGTDNARFARSLANLASAYDALGRKIEAENLAEQCLLILQTIFTSDHPSMAPAFRLLADIYQDSGRYVDFARMRGRLANIQDRAEASFGMCHAQI